MHPLIKQAVDIVATWQSDNPRELALAVADLCRRTLDTGGLPTDSPDWTRLRRAFDVVKGQRIADSILLWDECCTTADVATDFDANRDAFVKLGIVTWVVKLLLKQLGMLSASAPLSSFVEWKKHLCECLVKNIVAVRPGDDPERE